MKLQELKAKVYELAGVNNTKQLKAKIQEIKTLDMRLKISWEKLLLFFKNRKVSLTSGWKIRLKNTKIFF